MNETSNTTYKWERTVWAETGTVFYSLIRTDPEGGRITAARITKQDGGYAYSVNDPDGSGLQPSGWEKRLHNAKDFAELRAKNRFRFYD